MFRKVALNNLRKLEVILPAAAQIGSIYLLKYLSIIDRLILIDRKREQFNIGIIVQIIQTAQELGASLSKENITRIETEIVKYD